MRNSKPAPVADSGLIKPLSRDIGHVEMKKARTAEAVGLWR
jgi:hypothetical protein